MKKIVILFILLFSLIGKCSASYVPENDCYIYNVGSVQIGNQTSIESAYPVLGEVLCFYPGEPAEYYSPMYAICENGTIFLDSIKGNEDIHTIAKIVRIIWTKSDAYTAAGIHIGDSIQKVYKTYGYPINSYVNSNKAYDGIVKHWDIYGPENGLLHMDFGSQNGIITAIVVSSCSGGL